jgi:divalent metal cation (Fe/Co/Zn/Cd) transporter
VNADIASNRTGGQSERLMRVRGTSQFILILNFLVAAAMFGYGWWAGSVAVRADGVQS